MSPDQYNANIGTEVSGNRFFSGEGRNGLRMRQI